MHRFCYVLDGLPKGEGGMEGRLKVKSRNAVVIKLWFGNTCIGGRVYVN